MKTRAKLYAYAILYFLIISCFISGGLHFSSCSHQHVLVTVYISSHNNVMLLISRHILLSFSNHFHILVICFMFHACINLEVDKGNYKGKKALYSLYETVVYNGPKALLSLCETMTIYKDPKAL